MSWLESIKERAHSFGHAFRGIGILFKKETHARIHLFMLILVILAGSYIGLSRMEWVAILLSAALVMGMEALNAAVEKLADHVEEEHHRRIRELKDLSAGAVLITAMGASGVAAWIFLPKLF